MARPTEVLISRQALQHNLQRVREMAPQSKVLAMVKANGYGHQLAIVVKALAAADAFGVACIEEAMQVYAIMPNKKVILMEGVFADEELAEASQYNFEIVVHTAEQVAMLEKNKLTNKLTVWLKIDTGMNRLGFVPQDVANIWQRLSTCNSVQQIHFMTHFPQASSRQHPQTEQQIAEFFAVTKVYKGEKSLANSAAIINNSNAHADWVRPGIMLYGVSSFSDNTGEQLGLMPVMQLQSELIAIKSCKKNQGVGYNATWICPEDMLVGVVAIGYGDGYPRHASNGTPVIVNGVRTQIIGNVSMDMLTVDLRPVANARIGDQVILWGKQLPVERIAESAGTIAYELLTRINPRVRCQAI